MQDVPSVTYENASLLTESTYARDGSSWQYTTAGDTAKADAKTGTSDPTNPYGDVPQTVTLGRSPKDIEALTPTQGNRLLRAVLRYGLAFTMIEETRLPS